MWLWSFYLHFFCIDFKDFISHQHTAVRGILCWTGCCHYIYGWCKWCSQPAWNPGNNILNKKVFWNINCLGVSIKPLNKTMSAMPPNNNVIWSIIIYLTPPKQRRTSQVQKKIYVEKNSIIIQRVWYKFNKWHRFDKFNKLYKLRYIWNRFI